MLKIRILIVLAAIAVFTGFGAMTYPDFYTPVTTNDEKTVWGVLKQLGDNSAPDIKNISGISIEKGSDLVHKGHTVGPNGKKVGQTSKFYVCTTCHNVQKEFENQAEITPEKKLEYAIKNSVPFLQASSFYGIVNRTSFFNGDYQKKFEGKEGAKEAQTDLRAAIQFCAVNCAEGRKLDDWEVESILSYFWTLEFKMEDLKLNPAENETINKAVFGGDKASAIKLIKSKYAPAMPATFLKIPKYEKLEKSAYDNKQRLAEGKAIYELSCLHCHLNKKYSFFGLDNEIITFKAMEKATRTENYIFSMYFLVREGLPPRMGHRSYMPEFTAEKMSKEQLESLYLYVSANAKKLY